VNDGDPPAAPDDLISLIIENQAHYGQWGPGLAAREATLFQNASVGSSAGAICHAVDDLERWFRGRPQDRAYTADPEFVRRALADSLRLHANNVLIRTALAATVLPSGTQVAAGEVVILDRRAANAEMERACGARDGFDPHGRWDDQYPRHGLAFGGGGCPSRSRRAARTVRRHDQGYVPRVPGPLRRAAGGPRRGGRLVKITIDARACAATGFCPRIAPGVFSLPGPDGPAVAAPDAGQAEAVLEAEAACPTGAISVEAEA
jgi:ferredoxin/cytochrome P450